jgi:Holliday junction resolvase RusA-like endonuclease
VTTFFCTIPVEPQPWRRARGMGKRRFKDTRSEEYAVVCCWHMSMAMRAMGQPVKPLFPAGPVELEVRAFFPTGKKPRKRTPWPLSWKATRPDGDNVLKAIADASQGLLVADDGQYARMVVECFYAAQDGAGARLEVTARQLDSLESGE